MDQPSISPTEIELLNHPHQPRELHFWADIRIGGFLPSPDFAIPAYNSAARYEPPSLTNPGPPEKDPLPPARTTTVLHDAKWLNKQKNVKLSGPFAEGWTPLKKLSVSGFGTISIWEKKAGNKGKGRGESFFDDEYETEKMIVKNGVIESLIDPSLLSPSNPLEPLDFTQEARIMQMLKLAASKHIVSIRWPLSVPNDVPNTSTVTSKRNRVEEIYMEYCEGGDLEMEIWKRYEAKIPFKEFEIWWLAECLVKALMVLECGDEGGKGKEGWVPVVHFDMKPSNIFRGGFDGESMMRIYKLADFGNAEFMPRGPVSLKRKINLRRKATRGFYTPEQFTPRWDYKNWEKNEISGEYSTKTNIFGLGLILWSAVTLLRYPIPGLPYTSTLTGSKHGLTYGRSIEKTPGFSQTLKRMILTCLFERPDNRPSLADLKKLIASQGRGGGNKRGSWGFDFAFDLTKETLEREAREREEGERAREDREEQARLMRERAEEMEREAGGDDTGDWMFEDIEWDSEGGEFSDEDWDGDGGMDED